MRVFACFFPMLSVFTVLSWADEDEGANVEFACFTCNIGTGDDDTRSCVDKAEECAPSPSGLRSCSTLLYFSKRQSERGVPHMRKFCTSPGSADELAPLLERLRQIDGAEGICQSVDSWTQLASLAQDSPFPPPGTEGDVQEVPSATTRRLLRRINGHNVESGTQQMAELDGAFSPPLRFPTSQQQRTKRAPTKSVEPPGAGPPSPPHSHSSTLLCICSSALCNQGHFSDVLARSLVLTGQHFERKTDSLRGEQNELI